MSILGIIPARYASSRFPGKPLADIKGRAMILRVYDRALLSGVFKDVVVATDDSRIFDRVVQEGFNAVMTSESHRSGTDRCLEALDKYEQENKVEIEHVINIQGDEPFIDPGQIKTVAGLLVQQNAQIATLAKLISDPGELFNPNVVKVVFGESMRALYFSRSTVPNIRQSDEIHWLEKQSHYKHIGIYGFETETLRKACSLPTGKLEQLEALEQLRWLEYGLNITVGLTDAESLAIDTPEDLLKITNIA